ncbi:hypothetical protein [Xanthomonas sp. CFBP 7698]|uniref:hypothetical protein n=1 Tax=unclassified Xanthomonas TaxID=2643310 RepID=UPI000CEF506E|nr:hypothetical protein [Xanthomonas sp. CFBP 7698]PPU30083.1 hypothetical protein XspCFBP7912_17315 [Xanthomonas sp. CFBP 7912]RJS01952.1 hypothetical protein XnspCFBP7698_19940 [Xanthomonas sp. CFBP 7698]
MPHRIRNDATGRWASSCTVLDARRGVDARGKLGDDRAIGTTWRTPERQAAGRSQWMDENHDANDAM